MKHNLIWLDKGWQPCAIAFIPSEKAFDKAKEKYNFACDWPFKTRPNSRGHCQYLQDDDGVTVILVCVPEKSFSLPAADVLNTLVHESVHVWQFICDVIGEQHPGMEQEAYSIEAIFHQLRECFVTAAGPGNLKEALDAVL